MNQIENLLKQTIGLHAARIGTAVVAHAVQRRMQSHCLVTHGAYLRLLRQSPAEMNALIEAVVVAETWFFRDQDAFTALVRLAVAWFAAHPVGVLRLLSVPCSTGEEPYSMAMALLQAGFPPGRFKIDALDISALALAAAERGIYRKNSFRGRDLQFREDYFESTRDGYALQPVVKRQVNFQWGNLLDEIAPGEPGSYDFIFCRNLLIYFDGPTQAKALRRLRDLLAPSGTLFLSSVEAPLTLTHRSVSTGLRGSFAGRKPDSEHQSGRQPLPRRKPASTGKPLRPLQPAPMPLITGKLRPARRLILPLPLVQGNASRTDVALAEARRLTDTGHFTEAAALCETYLRERGASAEAYYLLGLARDAAGAKSQAGEMYRRALYLEPNHYNSLLQMASLSEKNGDSAHAKLLYERAGRAKNQT